jgi:hypothetical protein
MQHAVCTVVYKMLRIRLSKKVQNCRLPFLFMQERRCIFILQGVDFDKKAKAEISNLRNDELCHAASVLEWNMCRVDGCNCSQD